MVVGGAIWLIDGGGGWCYWVALRWQWVVWVLGLSLDLGIGFCLGIRY